VLPFQPDAIKPQRADGVYIIGVSNSAYDGDDFTVSEFLFGAIYPEFQ
jgi:hypothetical protein